MLKGDSKENGKKSIGLISKNKTTLWRGAHFLVHFFAIVLHDYNVTLAVTRDLKIPRNRCTGNG